MPVAPASQKNSGYYLGKVEYSRKWLLDQLVEDNDDKKTMLLITIKQVFDAQVYKGPRCNDTACTTKGKCPRNRHLNIVLAEGVFGTTGEKGWCSVMIHAYKKGDLEEAVFETHKTPSGKPVIIDFNIWGQNGSEKMVKGWFAEVEDAAMMTEMKDLMKKALTDACDADVISLQTEGYEEQ